MSELSFAIHRRDKRLNFRNCFFRFSFNFPADRYRSFDDSMSNVSLALINIHFSSGTVRPYLPNMIEIGGIQVKPKPSPLPQVNEEDNSLNELVKLVFYVNFRISKTSSMEPKTAQSSSVWAQMPKAHSYRKK